MGEYFVQGKHFAATQGRGHFADDEVLDLPGMYGPETKQQSIAELLSKVQHMHMQLHLMLCVAPRPHAAPVSVDFWKHSVGASHSQ